jgi:pyruvate dehydrogenase E2 component (dihydrolipoamide acetyltransferase)
MNTRTPSGPVVPVLMPQAGQSMEEGSIVRWLVAEGDTVAKGDILFEVETDKAVVEIEAAENGRLAKIVVPEGATVPVKTVVAVLADTDEDAAGYLSDLGEEGPSHEEVTASAAAEPAASELPPTPPILGEPDPGSPRIGGVGGRRIAASPLARKAAEARGVALASVGTGSGPRGRIMLADVERFSPSPPSTLGEPNRLAPQAPPESGPGGGQRRPMSRMRKAIARNLLASKQTIPHFYMKTTIEADALLAFQKAEKAHYRCSVNDVITLAVARLLMEFPAFRSQVSGDDIVEYPDANIGIAVGMDEGLVVPVLKAADTRNLKGIAAETRRLVEAARAGKVEGMGEGVFTISNLGMFGVEEFSAIINPPESAILAVGAAREEVVVHHGAFRPGHRLTLSLSADHRVIDGLLAARFMARLKELLETPEAI